MSRLCNIAFVKSVHEVRKTIELDIRPRRRKCKKKEYSFIWILPLGFWLAKIEGAAKKGNLRTERARYRLWRYAAQRRRSRRVPATAALTKQKSTATAVLFVWWGKLDSDQRSQWQQIYSLPPLAAREFPQIMELVIGVEPTTCWLQISCSAIEPHQQTTSMIINH